MYCNSMSFSDLKDIFSKSAKEGLPNVCFAVADDDIEYLIDGEPVSVDKYFRWMKDEFNKRMGIEYECDYWTDVINGKKEEVSEHMDSLMDATMVIFERPWKHNPALRLYMTACNIYRIPYAVI